MKTLALPPMKSRLKIVSRILSKKIRPIRKPPKPPPPRGAILKAAAGTKLTPNLHGTHCTTRDGSKATLHTASIATHRAILLSSHAARHHMQARLADTASYSYLNPPQRVRHKLVCHSHRRDCSIHIFIDNYHLH